MKLPPLFGRAKKDRERRAVIRCCQAAGVAMGQHTLSIVNEHGAHVPDRPAHAAIFFLNRQGLFQERLIQAPGAPFLGEGLDLFLHALERPE